jgi:tRNA-specific 2-thiouridylase
VHLDGRVLGRHEGSSTTPSGSGRASALPRTKPLYVVKLEHKTGRVIVGPREALMTKTVRLRDVNWLGDAALASAAGGNGMPVEVKVRSTRPPQAGRRADGRRGDECVS